MATRSHASRGALRSRAELALPSLRAWVRGLPSPDLRFEARRARDVRLFTIILLSIAIGMAVAAPLLGGASSLSTDPATALIAGADFATVAAALLIVIIRSRSPRVLEALGVAAGVLTLVESLYGQLNNPDSVAAVAAYEFVGIAVVAFALPWRPLTHYLFVALATPLALAGLSAVNDATERGALTGALFFAVAVSLIGKPIAWRSRVSLYQRTMQARRLNAKLHDLVRQDQTTGLATRAAFNAHLARLSQRPAGRIGFAMVDIDHFKSVNDALGHPAGDEVLKRTAAAVLGSIRDVDRAYRYGGEEFMVIFDRVPESGLAVAGERIRASVEALQMSNPGIGGVVTVSVGIAIIDLPAAASALAAAIEAADKALYVAKAAGRNRVVLEGRRYSHVD